MNPFLILLISLALLLLIAVIVFRSLDRTNGRLVSSGEDRSYLLYVPESYEPSRPTPLVITIHGFVQWTAHQMYISGWNDLADEHGFIVVYPSGTGFPKRWRTRAMPGRTLDPSHDVQFLSDLIYKIQADHNIDPERIYVNGLSNGGGMALLLACELSERIAAVGTVAGAFPLTLEECGPSRPVPMMVFHGTADPIVPYQGGPYRGEQAFPSIPEWVEALARRNGCSDPPIEIPASGSVNAVKYTGCDADVIFYTIHGGGHSWPGGRPMPGWIVGHTSMEIDATKTLWEFFEEHPLSDTSDPV